ncbi:MAG: two pore domain potassium channel family protein [Phenylobacterium sp.]|uniref:potassium channel family protein n=1 Tax=Phenylobacterium sp. TaxID=1871053 RepID=UPI001A3B94C0|nr:potassium channel family protein [Phenylobacterium sp.]MBL8770422.1 two pore domain potassium channel family protein [Phenylobacterium sp.]
MTDPKAEQAPKRSWLPRLRVRLRELYLGKSPQAVRFRYGVLAIDIALIAFFIAAPFLREMDAVFFTVDYLAAFILTIDIGARALTHVTLRDWLRRPSVWIDLFVLATLLFPLWLFNLAFLRVLRLWSLVHSDFFWETVGRRYDETRWEEVGKTVATLVTFVFVVTGFVYASFARTHPGISGYVDALYFTMTALTTTGFGDITLPGTWGKLLTIVIMVSGITLFVRLAQTLIRPYKVRYPCPTCGLARHDPDAVHCKACGTILAIPNDE